MKIIDRVYSKDLITIKYLIELDDKSIIETTYVNHYNKHIICFTVSLGCPVNCKFCLAGKFIRFLTAAEIYNQCKLVIDDFGFEFNKPILFSAMGEGESFLTVESLRNVIHVMECFDVDYKDTKFAISTSGLNVYLIDWLYDYESVIKRKLKLQISLHSVDDSIRNRLITHTSSLDELISIGKKYSNRYPNMVEWNYVLFKNINDKENDAYLLHTLLGNEKVKLNRYNDIGFHEFIFGEIKSFMEYLDFYGMNYEYYETDGNDIGAACGQLKHKSDKI